MSGGAGFSSGKFPDLLECIFERALNFGDPFWQDDRAGLEIKLEQLDLQSGAAQALSNDIVKEAVGSRSFGFQHLQHGARRELQLRYRRQRYSNRESEPGGVRHSAVGGGEGNQDERVLNAGNGSGPLLARNLPGEQVLQTGCPASLRVIDDRYGTAQ
jgi:hypothetical protein